MCADASSAAATTGDRQCSDKGRQKRPGSSETGMLGGVAAASKLLVQPPPSRARRGGCLHIQWPGAAAGAAGRLGQVCLLSARAGSGARAFQSARRVERGGCSRSSRVTCPLASPTAASLSLVARARAVTSWEWAPYRRTYWKPGACQAGRQAGRRTRGKGCWRGARASAGVAERESRHGSHRISPPFPHTPSSSTQHTNPSPHTCAAMFS